MIYIFIELKLMIIVSSRCCNSNYDVMFLDVSPQNEKNEGGEKEHFYS